MKYNLPYRFLIFLFMAWTVAALESCIKEDRSGCDPYLQSISVMFTDPYQRDADLGQGLNTSKFSRLVVFVYDSNGQLVTTTELSECSLYEDYQLDVILSPGEYDMVVWVGAETFFYGFEHTENLNLASLNLEIPENHQIDFWLSHLYYGRNSFVINTDNATVIVPMLQYTNDINFSVTGLESDHPYCFWIVDDNGKYSFKNTYLPCDRFGYHSDVLLYRADQFKSRMTIMRLSDGRNPVLILTDELTGEIIYPSYEGQETNLIALIKAAYENRTYNFDAKHTFNLLLEFDVEMKATVFIDNWEVKENDYEIVSD